MPLSLHHSITPSLNQRGALFGLDARIALAIFGIISVVAGASMVINVDETRAKALAQELTDTTRAIESFHHDLKTDIFKTLEKPSEKNAFTALFDNSVITEEDNLRHIWNGPYIRFASTTHPRYGEMLLQKRAADASQPCTTETDICYLWLTYSQVRPSVTQATNALLDSETETTPEKSGRLQWSEDKDGSQILHFRATRALSVDVE